MFRATFLVTYCIENVIIIQRSSSTAHGMVCKSLRRPQSLPRISCEASLFIFQFSSKYDSFRIFFRGRTPSAKTSVFDSLCHANIIYNLIQGLKSKSNPAPCDKKSRSEHQILLLTHVRGSGQETNCCQRGREGGEKKGKKEWEGGKREKGEGKEEDGRREHKAERNGKWRKVVYIYTTHSTVIMDQPTCHCGEQLCLSNHPHCTVYTPTV